MCDSCIDTNILLDKIDVVNYLSQYLDLTREGEEYFAICPFHKEKTASFSVTPSNGLIYCHGCHWGGNIIQFCMKYHNLTYKDTVEHLCVYLGILPNQIKSNKLSASSIAKKYAVNHIQEKKATYKILPEDIMNQYEIGGKYLDTWRKDGILDETMMKYSVKYDPISNRIVFPIRDMSGAIINVCGRTLDPSWKTKKLRKYTYFYSLGILDTFYGFFENTSDICEKKSIIIWEGAKSVMLAEQYGYKNSVAALTSRINPYQFKILISLGFKCIFAFDKEIDPRKVDEIQKLLRYVPVEAVIDRHNILPEKASPIDCGKDIWDRLYSERIKLN